VGEEPRPGWRPDLRPEGPDGLDPGCGPGGPSRPGPGERVRLFKLFRAAEWAGFVRAGVFSGSADDLRDGFVHLSTEAQLPRTLRRHFAGETGLVAAELALADDPALRWERAGDGALFPHLYRPLAMSDIAGIAPISGSAEAPAS